MSAAPSVARAGKPRLRVALIADFREENWPSMDRVATTLYERVTANHRDTIALELIRPPFVRRFSRIRARGTKAYQADRVLNRLVDYPRVLRRVRGHFDIFHIVDHSYAHLVHHLPAARTLVTCHDLDAFRCLIEPRREPRGIPFRLMTRWSLSGLRRARLIVANSRTTLAELLRFGIAPPDRLNVIAFGVADVFSPAPDHAADEECLRLLGPRDPSRLAMLHVGLPIPRKRLDRLLRIVAAVAQRRPVSLIRVGGALSPEDHALAVQLGVNDRVVGLPRIEDSVLAAVYRHVDLLVLPSDAEGFCFPLAEAMACGLPVIASDLPVMRETGGDAVEYVSRDDLGAWCEAIVRLAEERRDDGAAWRDRRARGMAQARRFSWEACAAATVSQYQRLAG